MRMTSFTRRDYRSRLSSIESLAARSAQDAADRSTLLSGEIAYYERALALQQRYCGRTLAVQD